MVVYSSFFFLIGSFKKRWELIESKFFNPQLGKKRKVHPLALGYNHKLPNVSNVIKKHFPLLLESHALSKIFNVKSIILAYRRTKNLKDISALYKLKPSPATKSQQIIAPVGCFRCKGKRHVCNNFLEESDRFKPGSHKRHKNKQRKQRMCFSSGTCEDK